MPPARKRAQQLSTTVAVAGMAVGGTGTIVRIRLPIGPGETLRGGLVSLANQGVVSAELAVITQGLDIIMRFGVATLRFSGTFGSDTIQYDGAWVNDYPGTVYLQAYIANLTTSSVTVALQEWVIPA